jgi:outer membrane murein-binding lipoprotein Lpp
MRSRVVVSAVAIAALCGLGSAGAAEEPPTRAQVEELQRQLAEMQKEMEALRSELRESEAKGAAYPMMHRHMQGMQQHWQRMHDQTCTMAPGTCPLGGQPPARP